MALLDYHDTALNGNTTIAYSNFRDVKARNLTAKGKRPKLREVYLPAITTFAAMIKNKDYGSN